MVKHIEKNHEGDIYICTIGHPKFSSDECVNNMDAFIKMVKNTCSNVDFITMRDVCGELGINT